MRTNIFKIHQAILINRFHYRAISQDERTNLHNICVEPPSAKCGGNRICPFLWEIDMFLIDCCILGKRRAKLNHNTDRGCWQWLNDDYPIMTKCDVIEQLVSRATCAGTSPSLLSTWQISEGLASTCMASHLIRIFVFARTYF